MRNVLIGRWRRQGAYAPPLLPTALLALFGLASALPWMLSGHDPLASDLSMRLVPPMWLPGGTGEFPLGTDGLGRDILSRVVYGARTSLVVAAAALAVAGAIGLTIGVASGYAGGVADAALMRLTDAVMSIPLFLVALMLATVTGPSEINIILVIGGLTWAQYARVIRGEVLSLREREFTTAARLTGGSMWWITTRHILPNVLPTFIVLATTQIGFIILLEASLSFLGAGVPPPAPAWGTLVADGRELLTQAWWVSFFPGLAVLMVVLSLNFLGDSLRDRLDPDLEVLPNG